MRIAPLALLVAAACGPAIPKLPSQGGPAWIELESDHFTVWTDGGEERGRALVQEIENLRQVVIGAAFHGATVEGRGLVIALHDEDEVHAYLPPQFVGMSTGPGGNPMRQPMILLSAQSNTNDSQTVDTHELAHLIAQAVIHRQPHWFAEGIARYFETVQIDARAGTADVGLPPETRRGQPPHIHHLSSLATVMACGTLTCMDAAFYATAWALFTYLTNVRPTDLARLEQRLEETHGDGDRAWDDVFGPGPASREKVQADVRDWLAHGTHTVLHFNVKLVPHPVTMRALSDADALAIRALLDVQYAHNQARALQEVDQALALDRMNVLAQVVDATTDRPHDLAEARATAEAHPDDWRAWWLLSMKLPGGATDPEVVDAREKACTRAQQNPALIIPPGLCAPG